MAESSRHLINVQRTAYIRFGYSQPELNEKMSILLSIDALRQRIDDIRLVLCYSRAGNIAERL